MATITTQYDLVWKLKSSPNYQFTSDGKCININRMKEIKRTVVGYSIGFCINGKFRTLSSIRNELTKIEINICPF